MKNKLASTDQWERDVRGRVMNDRSSNSLDSNQPVVEQAEITIHVYPHFIIKECTDQSPNLLSNSRKKKEKTELTYPGGHLRYTHNFNGGDLIWGLRSSSVISHQPMTSIDYGFVSLNGMDVRPHGTSERLNTCLYLVGASKAPFSPTHEDQSVDVSVASATYGSRSVSNVVVDRVYVGDKLVKYCPNINNEKEIFDMSYGQLGLDLLNASKITPVLKHFDIKKVKHNEILLTEKAIKMNTSAPSGPYISICNEDSTKFTPEEEAAANMQHFIMTVVQCAVKVLSDRNLITVNFKNNPNKTEYINLQQNELPTPITTESITNGSSPFVTATYNQVKNTNNSTDRYGTFMHDEDFFNKRTEEMLFISELLGLTGSTKLDPRDTSKLRSDILKAIIPDESGDTIYEPNMNRVFDSEADFNALDLGFSQEEFIEMLGSYEKEIHDTTTNLHNGAVYANKVTASKIVGTILGGGQPEWPFIDLGTNISNYKYV
jgi:hypothetical protein